MARRRLRREEYTVGWVCALPIELAAAQEMLDDEHEDLEHDENDNNLYSLGRIGDQSFDERAGSLLNLFDFRRPGAAKLFLDPITGQPTGR